VICVNFYGETNVGLVRTNNEDSFATLRLASNACLLVVCDGMGGLENGEDASRIAIDTFVSKVRSAVLPYVSYDKLSGFGEARVSATLENAVDSANEEVLKEISKRKDEIKVMGSTLVGILLINERAYVVSVGDSRAYFAFDGSVMQITKDHSYVQMLIEEGMLTPDEALKHPKRNAITRAIGIRASVSPDFYRIDLKPGCRLLLCSDGLTNYAKAEDIERILLSDNDNVFVCGELISSALAGGGRDNVTVIVLDY